MTQSKRIAVCILRYLRDELDNPMISSESKESLEVAIQCLESVYEVGPDDLAALAVRTPLNEMFQKCTGNERMCFKPLQPTEAAPSVKKEPIPEAESYKTKGNELLKQEKFTEALEMYSKAIDIDPNNAVYFCNRAAAFSKLEKPNEAIQDCEAALRIDPSYSKAYGRMGIAYAAQSDHQKALECYQKALELDPNNESYKNNLKVAQEQISGPGAAPGGAAPGFPGMAGGLPDFSNLLANPALMNMATQIMQDPGMQNLMSNIMTGTLNAGQQGGAAPAPAAAPAPTPAATGDAPSAPAAANGAPAGFNFDSLLRAGQQFAQQMQQTNGPLIDQLRREMDQRGMNPPGGNNQQQ